MATSSVYEYLTVAALELATGLDYEVMNAAFTDVAVEALITTTEELVNGILGVSTAQTVTNQITSATKFGAAWYMNMAISNLGYLGETNPIYDISWNKMYETLEQILRINEDVGIDSIAMSGADRFYKYGQ